MVTVCGAGRRGGGVSEQQPAFGRGCGGQRWRWVEPGAAASLGRGVSRRRWWVEPRAAATDWRSGRGWGGSAVPAGDGGWSREQSCIIVLAKQEQEQQEPE